MNRIARLLFSTIAAALVLAAIGFETGAVRAQNLFAPAIKVNDKVITRYELQQRARMLQLFRQPGDPQEEARKQLIEERLKVDAADAVGIVIPEADIAAGMEEFASRANMTTEQFIKALGGAGVAAQTYRDFIIAGVTWRTLIRAKFGPRVQVGSADIDRALASNAADGVRVLLSEIYIPAPPGREQSGLIDQIGQIGSGKARGSPGHPVQVGIRPQFHLLHVNLQNLLPPLKRWQVHINLTVEPARTEQGIVQNIRTVGGGDNDDAFVGIKTIHLHKQSIQGLLPLVMAASDATEPAPAHRIDLIDKNDAG